MSRSKECVVAVYKKLTEAGGAIDAIDRGGLPMNLVSLVSASLGTEANGGGACYRRYGSLPAKCPRTCAGSVQCEWSGACVPKVLQFGDEMERDAALGAGVGGIIGLLAGAGALTVTKGDTAVLLGPVIATTGIVGAFLGAMTGWGVHSEHLPQYEQKVKAGGALLVVSGNPLEVARATRILRDTHPAELHAHAETSADSYEIGADE